MTCQLHTMLGGRRALLIIACGAAHVVATSGGCASSDEASGARLGEPCKMDADCAPPRAADVASSESAYVRCASYSNAKNGINLTSFCQLVADGKEGQRPCVETRQGTTVVDGVPVEPYSSGYSATIVYSCDLARGLRCHGACLPPTPGKAGASCQSNLDCEPPLTCACEPTKCKGWTGGAQGLVIPKTCQ